MKVKDACDCSEDRENEIKKLLVAVKYKTKQEYDDAIDSFNRSNLSLEEIGRMAKSLCAETTADVKFNKRDVSFDNAGVY